MNADLKNKLSNWKSTLVNWKVHNIAPINSQGIELRDLYHALGMQPIGTCGGCMEIIFNTLYDLIIENKI